MNRCPAHRFGSRSQGIVLPTVLIMLLILSVASVVLVEQISSQSRMAGNSAATAISLQAAEATLQYATSQLVAGKYQESDFRGDANGLYFFRASNYSKATPVPWQTTAGWTSAKSAPQIGSSSANTATTEQKFMIEELPDVVSPGGSTQKAYRITARVRGPGNQGIVMLQTFYKL
jgi:Tfp pilus assembly protein PilX